MPAAVGQRLCALACGGARRPRRRQRRTRRLAPRGRGWPHDRLHVLRPCGTRLFHNPERNPQASIVKPGTLDDTSWLKPVGHIWTRSAQSWVPIPQDTVNYEGQPPDLSRLIEAWKAQQAAKI
jgi:hypothetical protein